MTFCFNFEEAISSFRFILDFIASFTLVGAFLGKTCQLTESRMEAVWNHTGEAVAVYLYYRPLPLGGTVLKRNGA